MAVQQDAVDQHRRADAGADEHERAGLVAARGAPPVLPEQRQVDVVLDDDGRAERRGEDVAHRHVAPAGEVRREHQRALLDADDARGAGGDGQQAAARDPGPLEQRQQIGGEVREPLLRTDPFRGVDDLVLDGLAAQVRDGEPGARRPDVHGELLTGRHAGGRPQINTEKHG